jgi:hypothetical protein
MTWLHRILPALAACLMAGAAHADDLASRLAAAAPALSPQALAQALAAQRCAVEAGVVAPTARLAVIDYSKPSTEPRLWVFDLDAGTALYVEHVAHGRNSGGNLAAGFSNREGSYQSSLGLYRTADTYVGGNGYSLRLDGLDPGLNDRARERYIVMHGAPYVDPLAALGQGRLGRSQGCPAVRPAIARELIDSLRAGHLLFAWHPDPRWAKASAFANCDARALAARTATPARDGGVSSTAAP